jgi:hypothetical protein
MPTTDEYEAELRRTPSGLGAVVFLVLTAVFSVASSAAEWAFWGSVFGR